MQIKLFQHFSFERERERACVCVCARARSLVCVYVHVCVRLCVCVCMYQTKSVTDYVVFFKGNNSSGVHQSDSPLPVRGLLCPQTDMRREVSLKLPALTWGGGVALLAAY